MSNNSKRDTHVTEARELGAMASQLFELIEGPGIPATLTAKRILDNRKKRRNERLTNIGAASITGGTVGVLAMEGERVPITKKFRPRAGRAGLVVGALTGAMLPPKKRLEMARGMAMSALVELAAIRSGGTPPAQTNNPRGFSEKRVRADAWKNFLKKEIIRFRKPRGQFEAFRERLPHLYEFRRRDEDPLGGLGTTGRVRREVAAGEFKKARAGFRKAIKSGKSAYKAGYELPDLRQAIKEIGVKGIIGGQKYKPESASIKHGNREFRIGRPTRSSVRIYTSGGPRTRRKKYFWEKKKFREDALATAGAAATAGGIAAGRRIHKAERRAESRVGHLGLDKRQRTKAKLAEIARAPVRDVTAFYTKRQKRKARKATAVEPVGATRKKVPSPAWGGVHKKGPTSRHPDLPAFQREAANKAIGEAREQWKAWTYKTAQNAKDLPKGTILEMARLRLNQTKGFAEAKVSSSTKSRPIFTAPDWSQYNKEHVEKQAAKAAKKAAGSQGLVGRLRQKISDLGGPKYQQGFTGTMTRASKEADPAWQRGAKREAIFDTRSENVSKARGWAGYGTTGLPTTYDPDEARRARKEIKGSRKQRIWGSRARALAGMATQVATRKRGQFRSVS